MRWVLRIVVFLLLLPLLVAAGMEYGTITDLPDLNSACKDVSQLGRGFNVEGNVLSYYQRPITREWVFRIGHGTNTTDIYEFNQTGGPATTYAPIALNDLVRLEGFLYAYEGNAYPGYKSARFLKKHPLKSEDHLRPHELFDSANLSRPCKLKGLVRDAFRDESDPNFIYLTMNCDGETAHLMIHRLADQPFDPRDYIGAEIIAAGVCADASIGLRRYMGRTLWVSGLENLTVVKRSGNDPATLPDIDTIPPMPSVDFARLGRHQTVGTVLAVWQGNHALLRTGKESLVTVSFQNASPPECGRQIRAIGIPETNLYFINLLHATWEVAGPILVLDHPDTDTSPKELLLDKQGLPQIQIRSHGKTIRMSGIVRYLPERQNGDARIQIEADGYLVSIDTSANPSIPTHLSLGCTISATGTCVMDINSSATETSSPQATGFFLVTRTPNDITLIRRPGWWTTQRLLIVIGILLLVLLAITLWNIALKRLAERRGKELAAEQVGRVTSDLKVYERTHLAVELHDSLSQTLSGVSMQIDAVRRFAATDPTRMNKHIDIAAKTLKSCRDELRNCLLDLRGNALEENDMNAAVRQTLEPYLSDAEITIRFAVPRDILSDNTAHTILRIIRELVVNALRHGHAAKIRVAGSVEDNKILFSVRDDGCGFSPETAPGIAEGHFGLQGIRERIEELEGTFALDSHPGKGTKATVAIRLPNPTGDENG